MSLKDEIVRALDDGRELLLGDVGPLEFLRQSPEAGLVSLAELDAGWFLSRQRDVVQGAIYLLLQVVEQAPLTSDIAARASHVRIGGRLYSIEQGHGPNTGAPVTAAGVRRFQLEPSEG